MLLEIGSIQLVRYLTRVRRQRLRASLALPAWHRCRDALRDRCVTARGGNREGVVLVVIPRRLDLRDARFATRNYHPRNRLTNKHTSACARDRGRTKAPSRM
jgi:hypothetical protein